MPILIWRRRLPPAARVSSVIDFAEDPHTAIIEGLACPGQFDPPGRADEQWASQLPFQRHDMIAQGRLGNPHLRRRPAEVQFLGHRFEIGELAASGLKISTPN